MRKPIALKKMLIFSAIVLLFLAFLFYVAYNGIPFYSSDGYKQLPQTFDNENNLIKYVVPNKKYIYWAFCKCLDSDTVIYNFGIKPKDIKIETPIIFNSFFGRKYIVYVDNGKVYYVQNIAEFKSFLGTIDNLQEAVLLARAEEELHVDDDIRGGTYMINSDTIYNLRLMRYISCPETKRSVYVRIEKSKGITDTSTLSTYYKGKGCIYY